MRAAYGASSGLFTCLKYAAHQCHQSCGGAASVRVVMIGCLVQEVADRTKAEAAAAAELATEGPRVEYLDGAGRARRDEGPRALPDRQPDGARPVARRASRLRLDADRPYRARSPPQRSGLSTPVDLISSRPRSSGVALSAIASADVRREDEGTGGGLARLGMRGQA
jgi:hypothetical protein